MNFNASTLPVTVVGTGGLPGIVHPGFIANGPGLPHSCGPGPTISLAATAGEDPKPNSGTWDPRVGDNTRGSSMYPRPGRCGTCGTELRQVDDEVWCPVCGFIRRQAA